MAKKTPHRQPQRRPLDRLAGHLTSVQAQLSLLLPGGHPLDRIRAINRLRFLANAMLDVEIAAAREAGYTWPAIGGAAGMSGPGAQRRIST
jgi:hypothetical protein